MTGYTLAKLTDAPNIFGDLYPGEMRLLKDALGTGHVAISYRRIPQHTGAKGGYGHRHTAQEEVVFVISGRLQVKAGDEVCWGSDRRRRSGSIRHHSGSLERSTGGCEAIDYLQPD